MVKLTEQRDYYWDYVKAIAILAVVLIHTINPMSSPPYGMLFRQVINFPVFVFFVIAGYFTHYNIGKTSYKKFILKKTSRLLPTLLLFSVMQAIFKLYFQGHYDIVSCLKALTALPLGFGYFVVALFQSFVIFPLFLHIPGKWSRDFLALILNLITIVFVYWLIFDDPLRKGVVVPIPAIFFVAWIFPFSIGYTLAHNSRFVEKIKKFRMYFFFLLIVSTIFAFIEALYFMDGYRLIACSQLKISTFIQSTCLTLVFFGYHKKIIKSNLICRLGQASFFIYLSHWFFIIILRKVFTYFPEYSPILNMWLISLAVIGGEVFTVYIMRKFNIKWLNSLLGIT